MNGAPPHSKSALTTFYVTLRKPLSCVLASASDWEASPYAAAQRRKVTLTRRASHEQDGETYGEHLDQRVGPALLQLVDRRASQMHGSMAAANVAPAAEAAGAAGGSRRGRRAAPSARSRRPSPIAMIAGFGVYFC